MSDSLNEAAANLAEILSDTTEFKDPVFAQTADTLKRFAAAGESLAGKAKTMIKSGLALGELFYEAYETAKDGKNPRVGDLKKGYDALIYFIASAQFVAEGKSPAQFNSCGDAVQKVLDKIEFTDKKKISELRKTSQAFFPTESALMKEAQAWSVRAEQVGKAIKAAVAKLDLKDNVQKVHASFMAKFATKVADAAKVVKG